MKEIYPTAEANGVFYVASHRNGRGSFIKDIKYAMCNQHTFSTFSMPEIISISMDSVSLPQTTVRVSQWQKTAANRYCSMHEKWPSHSISIIIFTSYSFLNQMGDGFCGIASFTHTNSL